MTSGVLLVTLPVSWQAGSEQLSMSEAMTELKKHAQEMAAKAQAEAEVAAQDLAAANAQLERAHAALEAERNTAAQLQVPAPHTEPVWMLKPEGMNIRSECMFP